MVASLVLLWFYRCRLRCSFVVTLFFFWSILSYMFNVLVFSSFHSILFFHTFFNFNFKSKLFALLGQTEDAWPTFPPEQKWTAWNVLHFLEIWHTVWQMIISNIIRNENGVKIVQNYKVWSPKTVHGRKSSLQWKFWK